MSYEGLEADFRSRLEQLVAASGGRIQLMSGFRSVERQQQLWDQAVKKYGSEQAARKWVAPPGKSNHNRGVAADLKGDLKLAARLAPQFGLHFPMGHEPWHVEPVHAQETADPDAYTPDPQTGLPPEPPRRDLKYQLTSFMDVITRGVTMDPMAEMLGEPEPEMEVTV